jgi:hypothetical protein
MKIVKIILSTLLFICLLKMPYWHYQFVRIAALSIFGVLAYDSYKNSQKGLIILFIGLAILFQPFSKIILSKEIWQIIDFVIGVFLLLSIFIKQLKNKTLKNWNEIFVDLF